MNLRLLGCSLCLLGLNRPLEVSAQPISAQPKKAVFSYSGAWVYNEGYISTAFSSAKKGQLSTFYKKGQYSYTAPCTVVSSKENVAEIKYTLVNYPYSTVNKKGVNATFTAKVVALENGTLLLLDLKRIDYKNPADNRTWTKKFSDYYVILRRYTPKNAVPL